MSSRDKVDGIVMLGAILVTGVIAYVSHQTAQSRIVHDCLHLQKFTVDGRVFSCYSQDEGEPSANNTD